CRETVPRLPDAFVQCVVTSPPYFGLRNGVGGIGTEATVGEDVANLVAIRVEVRRVLRDDGCLWLNLGETWREKRMLRVPARVALALAADGWFSRDEIIWEKRGATPETVRDRCSRDYEPVQLFTKSPRYYFDLDALRE